MRKAPKPKKTASPFKTEEERASAVKILSDIKKKHAPKVLELTRTARAAIQELKELEETMDGEIKTSVSADYAEALWKNV